jgi:hypothetical protein
MKTHLLFGLALLFVAPLHAQNKNEIAVPEPAAILARLKKEHPRLLASNADFATLQKQTKTAPRVRAWYAKFREASEKILREAPSEYEIPDGKRLLNTSRRVLDRVSRLALLYRLDGDAKWQKRAWDELNAAANFKDWNPSHFLDTAEMTMAFSLGYDWLYETWTPQQRAILKNAIVEKGLKPSLEVYRANRWWARVGHNWNQVCNGGMAVGALAIGDEEPQIAGEVLQSAIKSLPIAMKHFAPDGAWNEGPGYWSYATKYNVFVLAALDSALGTDHGLSQIPGFAQTGAFPPFYTGPIGRTFNYADSGDKGGGAPQIYWLATKFNNPGWAAWQAKWNENADPSPFGLLWGARWFANDDGTEKAAPTLSEMPLGRYFRDAEVVTMRSAWDDPNAIFVGFKAGDNKANHSHLDIGSFVMDALGVRWFVDIGADSYNLPGYFGDKRWTYYRLRAEGQNTLVINPDKEPDQDPKAATRITKFAEKDCCTLAVGDLTKAYAKDVRSVKRGVALLDGVQVLIQDEIEAKKPSRVYWFGHTNAKIEIEEDGKSATLSQDNKKLLARLLGPADAKFSVLDAAPLPTSPNPEKQRDNKAFKRLTVELKDATQTRLRVLLTPLQNGQPIPAAPEEEALGNW